ncbi:MAG: hypothetical protein N838_31030 [Thiohalocapsa sp. PB-PSB1]|nr:MAG: hypothetical protein N838_31030 [Thiohalocapsa sp. PB-PSB1]HCS90781.1 hypothetical protein [Chromatiaceae bacterium]
MLDRPKPGCRFAALPIAAILSLLVFAIGGQGMAATACDPTQTDCVRRLPQSPSSTPPAPDTCPTLEACLARIDQVADRLRKQ